MQGKVTLEDHFAIEATLGDSQPFGAHVWPELRHRLLDFQDKRLRYMDEAGVEIMIASLNAPAVQGISDARHPATLRRPSLAVRADLVVRRGDLTARHAADRQRPVRRLSTAADHTRPSR